jgi:hypothetical protein
MYRALTYFAWVAVKHDKQVDFLARIKAVNGDPRPDKEEKLKAQTLKVGATGVNESDVLTFLEWFLSPSLTEVSSTKNITDKLVAIRWERVCRIHVFCPDGDVPKANSM